MLRALYRLYHRLTTTEDETTFPSFLWSLYQLQHFQSNRTIVDNHTELSAPTKRFIQYYWRFAHIAFGKFRILPRWSHYWQHNDELLVELLGDVELVSSFWGSRDFYPGNYVVVDHCSQMVVWGIRATLCPEDVVIDVMADPAPFLTGQGHQGMVSAVGRLMQETWTTVEDALQRYPSYQLLITGHSLGGGMAAMLTLYIRHHHSHVSCFGLSFACPPCLCADLSQWSRPYVMAVTCQDDVIARLSFPAFANLKKKLFLITHVGTEKDLEEHGYLRNNLWTIDNHQPRLWTPVNHVYLFEDDKGAFQSWHVSGFCLDTIVVNTHFIIDHSPPVYDDYVAKMHPTHTF